MSGRTRRRQRHLSSIFYQIGWNATPVVHTFDSTGDEVRASAPLRLIAQPHDHSSTNMRTNPLVCRPLYLSSTSCPSSNPDVIFRNITASSALQPEDQGTQTNMRCHWLIHKLREIGAGE
ncbi:hypothetical protein KCV07_g499, partial [Aureobasidium melanogenum]